MTEMMLIKRHCLGDDMLIEAIVISCLPKRAARSIPSGRAR